MNQEQFDEFSDEEKIISLLLSKRELYKGELAEKCGFTGKTTKYRALRNTLAESEIGKCLIMTEKKTGARGGSRNYYKIDMDQIKIQKLYRRSSENLKNHFRNSSWLIRWIIKKNLKIDKPSNQLKQDVAQMLRASRIFFETFLYNEYSEKELRELSALIYYPVPDETFFNEPPFFQKGVDEQPSTDVSYLLYHLFSFCIFAEFLYLNPKNKLDKNIKVLLKKMSDRATDYLNAAQKNYETFSILDALIALWTASKDNQTQKIDNLDRLFTEYIKLRDVYWSIGRKDQELALELNKKYNEIAEILNLPKRERID